ncbi:MAG: bifunctional oligoribonuclease/PAP phosphatase NrnA [Undibacterium sp.]|nr:bifunctional oligoribonuclease/PAP phosphatase NrnA [Opitutaceae bacterium]
MERYFPALAEEFIRLRAALVGKSVAVVGHARPDGDCIGSQVALARVLSALGHDVICVNADPVPRRLEFLTRGMVFLGPEGVLARAERRVAVFVDCADHARGGERLKVKFPQPVGVVDHHLSNAGYAALNLIDTAAAATCEILAGLFFDAGVMFDAQTAQALYTGILTDTGQFRFGATSRRCFLIAGELVARGANPAEAGFELYERETVGKLQLLQRFLASLHLECGGKVCIGTLPDGIFAETGTTVEDTEGLVDYARSIEGVEIGVLIEARPHGAVKASLRAKNPAYRVDRIAAQFNGGGHACAAGLNLKSGAEDFYPRLVAVLAQSLAQVAANSVSP